MERRMDKCINGRKGKEERKNGGKMERRKEVGWMDGWMPEKVERQMDE